MRLSSLSTSQHFYSAKKIHHSTRLVHAPRQRHVLNSQVTFRYPAIHEAPYWTTFWEGFSFPTQAKSIIEKFCRDLDLDQPTMELMRLILGDSKHLKLTKPDIVRMLTLKEKLKLSERLAEATKLSDRRSDLHGDLKVIPGPHPINSLILELIIGKYWQRLVEPETAAQIATENQSNLRTPLKVFEDFYAIVSKAKIDSTIRNQNSIFQVPVRKVISPDQNSSASTTYLEHLFFESYFKLQIDAIYEIFYKQIYYCLFEKLFTQNRISETSPLKSPRLNEILASIPDSRRNIQRQCERLEAFDVNDVPSSCRKDYQMARNTFYLVHFQNRGASPFQETPKTDSLPLPITLIEAVRELFTVDVKRLHNHQGTLDRIGSSLNTIDITKLEGPTSHLNRALYYAVSGQLKFLISTHDKSQSEQLLTEAQSCLTQINKELKNQNVIYKKSLEAAKLFVELLIEKWPHPQPTVASSPTTPEVSHAEIAPPLDEPVDPHPDITPIDPPYWMVHGLLVEKVKSVLTEQFSSYRSFAERFPEIVQVVGKDIEAILSYRGLSSWEMNRIYGGAVKGTDAYNGIQNIVVARQEKDREAIRGNIERIMKASKNFGEEPIIHSQLDGTYTITFCYKDKNAPQKRFTILNAKAFPSKAISFNDFPQRYPKLHKKIGSSIQQVLHREEINKEEWIQAIEQMGEEFLPLKEMAETLFQKGPLRSPELIKLILGYESLEESIKEFGLFSPQKKEILETEIKKILQGEDRSDSMKKLSEEEENDYVKQLLEKILPQAQSLRFDLINALDTLPQLESMEKDKASTILLATIDLKEKTIKAALNEIKKETSSLYYREAKVKRQPTGSYTISIYMVTGDNKEMILKLSALAHTNEEQLSRRGSLEQIRLLKAKAISMQEEVATQS